MNLGVFSVSTRPGGFQGALRSHLLQSDDHQPLTTLHGAAGDMALFQTQTLMNDFFSVQDGAPQL